MLTDFLLEHRWLMPAVLVVLLVVGPPAGARLAQHPRATATLLLVALAVLATLTLLPTGLRAPTQCQFAAMVPTPDRVELFANLVLFVAPALLATIATARPVLVLAGAVALSAAIELLQVLVPSIGRSCDTNDLLSNAIGAAVGVLAGVAALRLARHRSPAPTPPAP